MAAFGSGARADGSFEAFLEEELASLRAALTKRAAALEAENVRLQSVMREGGLGGLPQEGARLHDGQPEAEASPPRPQPPQARVCLDDAAEEPAAQVMVSLDSDTATRALASVASSGSVMGPTASERAARSARYSSAAASGSAAAARCQPDASVSLRRPVAATPRKSLSSLKSRSGIDLTTMMPSMTIKGRRATMAPDDHAEAVAFVRLRASGIRPPPSDGEASWGWSRQRQNLATSFIASVIVLNAATLGLSTEYSPEWKGWLVVDSVFAAIFTAELVVNFRYYGFRTYFLGPGRPCSQFGVDLRWRLVEFMLVCLAIWEIIAALTVGSAEQGRIIFRVLRFARIARIVRLCRLNFFAELTSMVNGALGGLRTLAWSMMLMTLPLYVVALAMREGLSSVIDTDPAAPGFELDLLFQDLGASFFTIFRCTMGAECITRDGKPIFLLLMDEYGGAFGIVYAGIQVLFTFGLFNLVTAFFVENTVEAAKQANRQHTRQRLLDTQGFRDKMVDLVNLLISEYPECVEKGCQSVESIVITAEVFKSLREDARFTELLTALDVSVEDQQDLFNTLDIDASGVLDMEELVGGICKLRGEARRGDIVETVLVVRALQIHLQNLDDQMMAAFHQLKAEVRALGRRIPSGPSGAARAKLAAGPSEWVPQDWAQGSEGE